MTKAQAKSEEAVQCSTLTAGNIILPGQMINQVYGHRFGLGE